MPSLRDLVFGTWRAVPLLGLTQIISWGTLFYTPVLILPRLAAERGWSITFAMSGLSLALIVAGVVAPHIGRTIDRFGGRAVMAVGSLVGALGLVLIATTTSPIFYFAAWLVVGAGMASTMYDAAFGTLGYLFGRSARAPITAITLMGGFASTVSWPLTGLLLNLVGWQETYLIYAAIGVLVAAPIHAFAMPRERDGLALAEQGTLARSNPDVFAAKGLPFLLVATAFAAYAFVPSALAAHMIAIFQREGIDALTAVTIGALFGPAQVAARLIQFAFGGGLQPLPLARIVLLILIAAFAMLIVAGVETWTAALFAIAFGGVNGLMTILRGTLPLALFGPAGFGHLIGRIATPFLVMQAAAPLVMAAAVERASDQAALALSMAFAMVALASVLMLRPPPKA